MVGAVAAFDLGIGLLWREEERALDPVPTGDAALAAAAARGDRAAFGRLVDAHKRTVHAVCTRLLRDPEDALDAAQETFVRAYSALDTYDPAQPFAPWLLRIARNHALDVLRRRLPRSRQVELDADAAGGAARDLPDPDAPRGDEVMERRQAASAVARAVEALPDNYREVVRLFHVEHLSYKEIAAAMDVPIGTVMTWLHRARARLKAELATGGEEALP